ncbi:hypothetical protein pb186bvf_007519 [Paramecium bursaria]
MQEKEAKYLHAIQIIQKIQQLQKQAINNYEDGMVELMYSKMTSERFDKQLNHLSFPVQPAHIILKNLEISENNNGFHLENSDDLDDDDELEISRAIENKPALIQNQYFTRSLESYLKIAQILREELLFYMIQKNNTQNNTQIEDLRASLLEIRSFEPINRKCYRSEISMLDFFI